MEMTKKDNDGSRNWENEQNRGITPENAALVHSVANAGSANTLNAPNPLSPASASLSSGISSENQQ